MGFRYQRNARRSAVVAAIAGMCVVLVFGPLAAVPAVALVALVYYGHQLVAVLAGDDGVMYPALALVVVVNATVVLLVQAVVVVEGLANTT